MVEANDAKDKKDALQQKPTDQPLAVDSARSWPTVFATALALAAVAAGGGYVIWWSSAAFVDLTARWTFIMGSSLNLGILLAIAAQACIYWGQRNLMRQQWLAMRDQLLEMKQQAKVNAMQFETQLDVTGIEIQAAEQSAINAQRAYVVAKIKDIGDYDDMFQFRLQIENGGNTPANNVCVYYSFEMRKEPPWPMQSIGGPGKPQSNKLSLRQPSTRPTDLA